MRRLLPLALLLLSSTLQAGEFSRFAFSPFWGPYVGDTFSLTQSFGAQGMVRWTRHLGTAVDFGYLPLEIDPASAFGSAVVDKKAFHLSGSLAGFLPAEIHLSDRRTLQMEFFGLLGGGWTHINAREHPHGLVGLGHLLHLAPWFAVHTQARMYLYKLPISPGGFSVDGVFLLGPTLLF